MGCGWTELLEWSQQGWASRYRYKDLRFLGFGKWKGDRIITPLFGLGGKRGRAVTEVGADGRPLRTWDSARFLVLSGGESPELEALQTDDHPNEEPIAFASTSDGVVVMVYRQYAATMPGSFERSYLTGDYVVRRWIPGDPVPKRDLLPELGIIPTGGDPAHQLLVFGADDIYIPGKGKIAHFNGTTWTKIDILKHELVSAMDRAPDGTLWVAVGIGGLVRIPREGSAEWIPLPDDEDLVSDVWARAPDEIWVALSRGHIYQLRPSQLGEPTP